MIDGAASSLCTRACEQAPIVVERVYWLFTLYMDGKTSMDLNLNSSRPTQTMCWACQRLRTKALSDKIYVTA